MPMCKKSIFRAIVFYGSEIPAFEFASARMHGLTPRPLSPRLPHLLCAALGLVILGCSEYPDRGDVARVSESASPRVFTVDSLPYGVSYDRLVGTVGELHGRITNIVNKGGAVGITVDDKVACFFARKESGKVSTFKVGDFVRVRGVFISTRIYRAALDACIVIGRRCSAGGRSVQARGRRSAGAGGVSPEWREVWSLELGAWRFLLLGNGPSRSRHLALRQ